MEKTLIDSNQISELRELLCAVAAGPTGDRDSYLGALRRLDAWAVAGASERLPGELRHFLSKRSYAKALIWVDNAAMAS